MFNQDSPFAIGFRRKYALPDNFRIHTIETHGCVGYMKVSGIATDKKYTKGKRKGSWNYRGKSETLTVTDSEIAQFDIDYEKQTGNCARCEGKGEVFAKWSRETGTEHRECPKCKGVGKIARET